MPKQPGALLPSLPEDLIPRPHLLDQFTRALNKKIVLLTAPAGYGRTTLLLQLAHRLSWPTAWISLTEKDRETSHFLLHAGEAIARVLLPKFSPRESPDDPLRFATLLAAEVRRSAPKHFLMILDDFHLVADRSEARLFLTTLLDRGPAGLRLILSSRAAMPLPELDRWIARGQVDSLGLADLAFHIEELQALLDRRQAVQPMAAEAIRHLAHADGWITGLLLTTGQSSADRLPARLSDYFACQVFQPQPVDVREFLMRSACLGVFDPCLGQEVLDPFMAGGEDVPRLLQEVRARNLFLLPAGAGGNRWRYHPMFEQFLRARLRELHPGEEQRILERLARLLVRRKEWQRAGHVLSQIGDARMYSELIEQAGERLLQSGRPDLLRRWLDEIPAQVISEHPRLLSIHGATLSISGQASVAYELLSRALERLPEDSQAEARAQTLVRRSFTQRFLGQYEHCITDAQEAMRLAQTMAELKPLMAEAQRALGLGYYRLGDLRQSLDWLRQAMNLYAHLGEEDSLPIAMMELGMVCRAMGDYETAETHYRQALARWQESENLGWQANLFNNLGGLYHAQGRYSSAVSALERGLGCARQCNYLRMEALLLISLAEVYAELEEVEAAREMLQQALQIGHEIRDHFVLFYSLYAGASLALQVENLAEAQILLEQIEQKEPARSPYEAGLFHFATGRLRLVAGQPAEAISQLEQAIASLEHSGRMAEPLLARSWMAAACAQDAQTERACETLRPVLRHGDYGPAAHALALQLVQAARWLAPLSRDVRVGRALLRLQARGQQVRASFPAVRATLRHNNPSTALPPALLRIQAFGAGNVWAGERLIGRSDWQTQSVRELFFFFLNYPHGVTKEQLGLNFWPDVPADQLKLRFKNGVYRLRRAIGPQSILFRDSRYLFNRDLRYEYDVETFEANLAQARRSSDAEERILHYRAALSVANEPYLTDLDADWVSLRREQLQVDVLNALMEVGELHLGAGQPGQALQACQRALRQDTYMEEAYRLSMRVHAALGDRPAVQRQYQVCRRVLREDLGVEPSAETTRLYQQLIR